MSGALISALLTAPRRLLTASLSLGLIALISSAVVWYLDHQCAQLGLALLTVVGWIACLLALWWLAVMALSPWLILPSVLTDWVISSRSPFAFSRQERDEVLNEVGLEVEELSETDPRLIRINPSFRFRLLFCAGVFGSLLITHLSADGFLTRLQSVGFAVVQLRSDDSAMRLKGLNMIVDYGPRKLIKRDRWGHAALPKSLSSTLISVLRDPHEGVQARAAFVSGLLEMPGAVEPLRELASQSEVLRDAAILALSAVPLYPLKPHPAHDAIKALSQDSKIQESAPLALVIALGRQRIYNPELLDKLYHKHIPLGPSTGARPSQRLRKVREAIAWALGELESKAAIPTLTKALNDPELSVRCIASYSLERLVFFESSQPLQRAFERSNPDQQCERTIAPQQEGAAPLVLMKRMSYQLALMRALATTDDPELLTWMAAHQKDANPTTQRFMFKYHEALSRKDRQGRLKRFKELNQARRERERVQHP